MIDSKNFTAVSFKGIKPFPKNLHYVMDETKINGRPQSQSLGKWYADEDFKIESDGILSPYSAGKNALRAQPISKPSFLKDSIVAFPSLITPSGFFEFSAKYFKERTLCPYTFKGTNLSDSYPLGQYGPSVAEDMVLTYEDNGKTFVLVAKRPNSKIWTIVGGGMEKSNTLVRETGSRELREEGVKYISEENLKEYMNAIKNSKLVYAGLVWDDPRNTGNGWMETKAFVARISKNLAMSLKLGTTLDEDNECDVKDPKWMEITETNMEKNNLIECHRLILRRAIHCFEVRYCNLFEIPWTMEQLRRFRTINLAEMKKGKPIAKYDPQWWRVEKNDPAIILPILGPSGFDRLEFYSYFVVASRDLNEKIRNELIYWDPMNYLVDEENSMLCRLLERNAFLHHCSFPIFIFPKDLVPHVTWDEMVRVAESGKKPLIFIENNNGKEMCLEEKIPEDLKSLVIKYDSLDEVASYIIKVLK